MQLKPTIDPDDPATVENESIIILNNYLDIMIYKCLIILIKC